jgi:hypothetical protein
MPETWLLDRLRSRYAPVLVILSPPRCGSTAVARSLWQHPAFRWYVHEPYDRVYHRAGDRKSIESALSAALDAAPPRAAAATGLIIKEMTFQVGARFAELMTAATLPVLVTVRDPRLAIRSRMRQRKKTCMPPCFPIVESGWPDLQSSLAVMRGRRVPYVIVDFTDLRRRPAGVLPDLCRRLGLSYTPAMLSWPGRDDITLGQLGGEQRDWYARVLTSTGFQPDLDEIPKLTDFPADHGMRAHVAECLRVYREITDDRRFLADPLR